MPAGSIGSKAAGGGLARGSGAELLLPAGQQSSHELGLDGGLDGRQHAGQAAELAIELLAAAKPPPLDPDAAAAQAVGGLLVQRLQSKLSQAGSVAASAAEVGRVQGCVCLGGMGHCLLHAARLPPGNCSQPCAEHPLPSHLPGPDASRPRQQWARPRCGCHRW